MIKNLEDISDEELKQIWFILTTLAKRKDPNINRWLTINKTNNTAICNICESCICNPDVFNKELSIKIFNHIIFHFKKYKLLVWL